MERYRSGCNGTDSKSVWGFIPHVGSNPTLSAIIKNKDIVKTKKILREWVEIKWDVNVVEVVK